jgi:hypothetical protein
MKSALRGRLPGILLLALLSTGVPWSGGAEELQLYRPRHRPAAELAVVAEGILGPSGTAVADPRTGKLVLIGPPAAVKQTLRALRELDVPLSRYRVEARLTSERELRQRGLVIHGWLEVGDLRIGRVGSPTRDPGVVFRTLRTEGAKDLVINLSVLEGHTAEIWTGTVIPVHVRVFQKQDRDPRVFETTPLAPIRTGFQVRPRSLGGGSLELEIAAVSEEEGAWGPLFQTVAATSVTLELGEQIAIADVRREMTSVYTSPFARHEWETQVSDALLWIRVSSADSDPRP